MWAPFLGMTPRMPSLLRRLKASRTGVRLMPRAWVRIYIHFGKKIGQKGYGTRTLFFLN